MRPLRAAADEARGWREMLADGRVLAALLDRLWWAGVTGAVAWRWGVPWALGAALLLALAFLRATGGERTSWPGDP